MELKLLKSFHAVAELLHFRRAAQRIGVTQPALSQHVAKLESELGVQLFERDRRTVRLTAAGNTLRDETVTPLAQLDSALSATRRVGGLREKTLKIGQLQYISHAFLPPAINSLKRARPDVLAELIEMPPHDVVGAVRDGWIDIGFGLTPMPRTEDLVSRDVVKGSWVVWVPKKHPFAQLDHVPISRVIEEPIVLFERSINPHTYDWLIRLLGPRARVAHHVQQPQHGVPHVLHGLGVFIVGSYVIQDRPRGVVSRPLSGFENSLRVTAVWRPDGRQSLLRPFLAGLPRLRG
ncbi:MAG: LysR family transcriptional regulator [Archangium sp.]